MRSVNCAGTLIPGNERLTLGFDVQGYGWLQPTQGALQFMQCLTQAITTSARKNLDETKKVHFVQILPYLENLHSGLSVAERIKSHHS